MSVKIFSQIRKDDIASAGGKGANLGELVQAGLPVPAGFVITTAAYDAFVKKNKIGKPLMALVAQTRPEEPGSYEEHRSQIRDLFLAGAMPVDMAREIRSAYAELGVVAAGDTDAGGAPVAVRSSATAEDLPGASFAGQQETYLNISGDEALLQAVKECWASLWTPRAMAYRARQGIDPASVSLAVVVQKMVNAKAAGILFTANPNTGRRDEAMIDAAWGLGEAIVGGLVTPDQWVINKVNSQVISSTIADKATMTVRTPAGVAQQPVPAAQRSTPAISQAMALRLVQMGVQIEDHYGMPMDIEWAVADGAISILQARPITALPEPSSEPPTEWPLPFGGYFTRGSIVEQMPDPLSPLFGTLATPEMSRSINALFGELVDVPLADTIGFETINGYVYMFMKVNSKLWKMLAQAMPKIPMVMGGGMSSWWHEKFLPRYQAEIAKLEATPPAEMPALALLEGARELAYQGTAQYTGVQIVIPVAIMAELSFAGYYNALVKGAGEPPAHTLLLGFDSQPILADKALYDMAMWSREQPALAQLLAQIATVDAADLLQRSEPLSGVDGAIWQEWQTRFQAYLKQYGDATYNLDFMYPVVADDPAPIFETFKFYLKGEGRSPYVRQAEATETRERMTRTILSRLDPVRAAGFSKLLKWAQSAVPAREDSLAVIGLGWPLLRRLLLELGRRLMEAGAIATPDDIFWLEDDEVKKLAAALDRGLTQLPAHGAQVAERKMEWRGRKRVAPPIMLPRKTALERYGFGAFMPAASEEQSGPVIKGTGVGQGSVTATARVLHHPSDFAQLKPGDVLVAAITTPAWTPLFALAAAVVTDVGGPMSHGSIVAREYGIPAVLGTAVATKRIKSGQQIRVDGDAGTVTLLDEVEVKQPQQAPNAKAGKRKMALLLSVAGAVIGLFMWWRRRRRR